MKYIRIVIILNLLKRVYEKFAILQRIILLFVPANIEKWFVHTLTDCFLISVSIYCVNISYICHWFYNIHITINYSQLAVISEIDLQKNIELKDTVLIVIEILKIKFCSCTVYIKFNVNLESIEIFKFILEFLRNFLGSTSTW